MHQACMRGIDGWMHVIYILQQGIDGKMDRCFSMEVDCIFKCSSYFQCSLHVARITPVCSLHMQEYADCCRLHAFYRNPACGVHASLVHFISRVPSSPSSSASWWHPHLLRGASTSRHPDLWADTRRQYVPWSVALRSHRVEMRQDPIYAF